MPYPAFALKKTIEREKKHKGCDLRAILAKLGVTQHCLPVASVHMSEILRFPISALAPLDQRALFEIRSNK